MKKKLLEILIIAFMFINTVPVFIYAEGTEEGEQGPEEKTVEILPSENDGEQSGIGEIPAAEGAEKEGPDTPASDKADKEDNKEEVKKEDIEKTDDSSKLRDAKNAAGNDETQTLKPARTIMMYICGSDLESYSGMATFSLEQILNSYSAIDEQIKLIIMCGGAVEWYLDSKYLFDLNGNTVDGISHTYNTIWKVESRKDGEGHDRMVLLDDDGIFGDGENAVRNEPAEDDPYEVGHYERMNDPLVLKMFINYCADNYPADRYDLILWDHGGGPVGGFGADLWDGTTMPFSGLVDALSNNRVVDTASNKRFDFINFDACLMNSVELNLALMDLTDYYFASAELIPGYGQPYTAWFSNLYQDPNMDTYDLGKKLVDEYVKFYSNPVEGKNTQDGTMAAVNMIAMRKNDFAGKLSTLVEIMNNQIRAGLYYDELLSFDNAITYGGKQFFDFGNIISQIAIAQKELSLTDNANLQSINDKNAYYDVARGIYAILNNRNIIYSGNTAGIKTSTDFLYRDKTDFAELKFSDSQYSPMGSSGMYIFFDDLRNLKNLSDYYGEMIEVMKKMPDGTAKRVFGNYRKALLDLVIIARCGQAVSDLVNSGCKKEDISYSKIKEYWQINPLPEDYIYYHDASEWGYYVSKLLLMADYATETDETVTEKNEFLTWINTLIPQLADEAIDKNNIEVYSVETASGTGYKVRIGNTRKRVIKSINYSVIAELPLVKKFVDEEGLGWISQKSDIEIYVGNVRGEQEFDMDISGSTDESFMRDYIAWLNNDTSTWDIGAVENKWYALTDENGQYHVIAVAEDGDKLLTIASYSKIKNTIHQEGTELPEVETEDQVIGIYFERKTGDIDYIMMMDDSGNWRSVEPKDLKQEMTITPIVQLEVFTTSVDIPISTSLILSAQNRDKVKVVYTDVDNIKDIADTDGDGDKLTRSFTVSNIYGSKIEISDKISNPDGALTDINLATIEEADYTGGAVKPVIKVKGNILEEGKNYELGSFVDEFKDVGAYYVGVVGINSYTGTLPGVFYINPVYQNDQNNYGKYWREGSVIGVRFIYMRTDDNGLTYKDFRGIMIDGNPIINADGQPRKYIAEEGSVIITLMPRCLEQLSNGTHTFTAVFTDAVKNKDLDEEKYFLYSEPVIFTIERLPYRLPVTGIEQQAAYQISGVYQ